MAKYCILILRYSVGIVYVWFGAVKFFPEMNPHHDLAFHTVDALTFNLLKPEIGMMILGLVECIIGIGLITFKGIKIILPLLALQLLGTFVCFFMFYDEIFIVAPYRPTLEGQLLLKNLIIIGAGMVIGASARGGAIVTNDQVIGKI